MYFLLSTYLSFCLTLSQGWWFGTRCNKAIAFQVLQYCVPSILFSPVSAKNTMPPCWLVRLGRGRVYFIRFNASKTAGFGNHMRDSGSTWGWWITNNDQETEGLWSPNKVPPGMLPEKKGHWKSSLELKHARYGYIISMQFYNKYPINEPESWSYCLRIKAVYE